MKSFFSELKRRNVFRAAALYAATAWLLVQVATQVFPFFQIANWLVRWVIVAAAIGFPFWVLGAWFYQWTPQGLARETEEATAPLQPEERQSRRNVDRWIMAILAIAVVLLLTDKLVLRERAGQSPGAPEKSIAVLPMINSSTDPANEYFSDGMSEEFISSLGRLPDLKVVGRTSSFQFKGKTDDSKTIGEKLGVSYLLEGSVQKSADRVRIWVGLIKSGDGANIWSETYDRDLKDIFAVQSEIAGSVAKALKVALLGTHGQTEQLATAATPFTQNVEAYNAFLQGNFYNRRLTAEDVRKAITYYEEAIRLDPRYALAYAKLSIQLVSLANGFSSLENKEKQEVTTKARAAADRALQLDPNLAEAHVANGYVLHLFDFDFAAAEKEFRRALELAPQEPSAAMTLSGLLATLGRVDEAVTVAQRAVVLDPLRSGVHSNLASYLTPLGRYDEAEAALHKAIALQPQAAQNHFWLAIIKILRGQPGAAVELAKKETDPFWRTYALAQAYFAQGNRAEADAKLQIMIDTDADGAGSQIAEVYALRKEPDKMFEWLDRGWNSRDPGVAVLLFDPFLHAYKDDPRFIAFAQKIGVTPKTANPPGNEPQMSASASITP
jgi:TolB-like protein/Flp pilus assembly protein TadD